MVSRASCDFKYSVLENVITFQIEQLGAFRMLQMEEIIYGIAIKFYMPEGLMVAHGSLSCVLDCILRYSASGNVMFTWTSA